MSDARDRDNYRAVVRIMAESQDTIDKYEDIKDKENFDEEL